MSSINNITPEMHFARRKSRKVMVANVQIGGDAPISVQTMTKTKTADYIATVEQIKRCQNAGADIIRVTVNDQDAANAIEYIVKNVSIPVVADIHFNYKFAIQAIESGIAKVRINPGNIGSNDRIKLVLDKAKERNIPIRIGVNSGSLQKDILDKYGYPSAEALYESAMRHVEIAQDFGFDDLIIAVKSTSVPIMINAYRLIAQKCDFPLHLGVTEAGTIQMGTLKSAIGIGTLLAEGIGDTIRVSLTDEPETEVITGKNILKSLGFRKSGIEIISCPTCGRLEYDLINIVKEIEIALQNVDADLTIAIMGCAVNGPGEAKGADLGIAGGKGEALLFKNGEIIRKIQEKDIVKELYNEVLNFNA